MANLKITLLAAIFVALTNSVQAQAQAPGSRLKKVRLAIPSLSGSNMPAIMAKELGYYRQEGFDTEIIVMRGTLSVQALVAGNVDYTGTPGATVAAAVQGVKVAVVMAYSNKPLYDLVVRPEISSYAELKGKVIGLGSLTGFAFDIPRLMLSRNGLDPKQDVKMISIGSTADRWTALKTNTVQATLLEPPYTFIAAKEGFRRLEYSGDYYQTLFGALTTSEQKIKADADEVSRFVRATAQGFLAYRDRRDTSIATLQRFLKLPDKQIAQQNYDYHRATLTADGTISDELMRTVIETQRQSAGVTRLVSSEEVFNFGFIRAAMSELMRKESRIRKCGFSGLVASVGILFSACVFAPPGYAAGENKLTIAMLNSATQTPYYVAVESGLYKHYGLEVVPVQFSGGDY